MPRSSHSGTQPRTVEVNAGALVHDSADVAHVVHEILFETGLAPGRLELEVTETALVRDLNRALATLRRIKNMGVRIAMDDFGTGYSSLSNLRAIRCRDQVRWPHHQVGGDVEDQARVHRAPARGRALQPPVQAANA